MNRLNINIDRLVMDLRMPMSSARAEGIASDAASMLEEFLRNHIYNYSASVTGFSKDSLDIPTISVSEGTSDMEISKKVAVEIFRALIKEGGL